MQNETPQTEQATSVEVTNEKLKDASTPGYWVETDPSEAERAGAFHEDALTEVDAIESAEDLPGSE